jgi:hypothetical protein
MQKNCKQHFRINIIEQLLMKYCGRGKENAMSLLYGTWEDNFQLLFRWREAILEKMSNLVIEIDLHVEEGRNSLEVFFMLLILVFNVSVRGACHISLLILMH